MCKEVSVQHKTVAIHFPNKELIVWLLAYFL